MRFFPYLLAVAGFLGGAWLVGVWLFGVALMVVSVVAALVYDDGRQVDGPPVRAVRPSRRGRTHQEILEEHRRAA
jgi:hypothetical protein